MSIKERKVVTVRFVDLGRADELLQQADVLVGSPWSEAALAIVTRRATEASRILIEAGALSDAAYAGLRSGEETLVRRAVDFYRSVGATRYRRQGEAQLLASA
jgi:hypothetical protein